MSDLKCKGDILVIDNNNNNNNNNNDNNNNYVCSMKDIKLFLQPYVLHNFHFAVGFLDSPQQAW